VLAEGDSNSIRQACQQIVDEAQAEADLAPAPDPATALLHVYGDA
jgi:TPP-dependent pyruvate/acetoin dehydrogenase alpha subunit